MKKLITIVLLAIGLSASAQNEWFAPSVFYENVDCRDTLFQTNGSDTLSITTDSNQTTLQRNNSVLTFNGTAAGIGNVVAGIAYVATDSGLYLQDVGLDTVLVTFTDGPASADTVHLHYTGAYWDFQPPLSSFALKATAFGNNGWVQYNLNDSLYADTLFTRSSSTNNTWIAKLAQADTAAQLFVGNYLGALNAAGYGYGSYNSATGLGAFSAAFKAGSSINNTMYSGVKGQTNTNAVITTVNVTNNQGTTSAYSSYLSDSTRAVLYLSAQETDSATFPAALSYKRSGAQRGFYVDNQTPGWFIRGGTKFRLPVTDGSSGYALTTNGSGTLSFSNLGDTYWSLTGNAGTTAGTNFIGTSDSKDLYFKTKNTTAIVVDTNQNVGIGTTTPVIKLDVNGGVNVSGLLQQNFGVSSFFIAPTGFGVGLSIDNYQFSLSADTSSKTFNIINNNLGWPISSFSISDSGNVLIGSNTSIPTAKLQVDTSFRYVDGNQAAGYVLTSDASGNATWSPTAFTPSDSVTIYALSPTEGTSYYCTDCTGNGITGRIVTYIGALWRRLTFE